MALALRTMVIPTAANDTMYSYAGGKPRREWVVHLQVRGWVWVGVGGWRAVWDGLGCGCGGPCGVGAGVEGCGLGGWLVAA